MLTISPHFSHVFNRITYFTNITIKILADT